jgi:phage terminase large subunit-like protein
MLRNLSETALAELRARYEGTRTGRQELYGELLMLPKAHYGIEMD